MPDLGLPEILLVIAVAMLLFGSSRLPDIARSLGRSLRIANAELRGLNDGDSPAHVDPASPRAPGESQNLRGWPAG